MKLFSQEKDLAASHSSTWSKHPPDVTKLNVDAATTSTSSWVVVVAQDGDGNLLSWWGKDISLCV